jgi:flagellin-like hook-associated protein FlgL
MNINNIARNQMSEAMLRLASGNRINSAADDPAGLAIMQGMEAGIRGLEMENRGVRDAQAAAATREGDLAGVSDNLQRIRELAIQGTSGTVSPAQQSIIQNEIAQIAQDLPIDLPFVNGQVELADVAQAITDVNADRAALGAQINTLEYTAAANSLQALNLADARSRIADSDMAAESTRLEQERTLNDLQILMQVEAQEQAHTQAQALGGGVLGQ